MNLKSIKYVLAMSLLVVMAIFNGKAAWSQESGADLELKTLIIEEQAPHRDGSTEAGYKADTVKNVGPWGDRKNLDTPYSMATTSSDLIENTIVGNLEQLFKMNPLISRSSGNIDINNISSVGMRGFSLNSTFVDGIRASNEGMGMFLDDKERVEVYSGLSGFLFGSGNVGGVVNYVTKRPTPYYLNKITTGYRDGSSFYGHVDVGGPVMNGKFGYRLNVMYQEGGTSIDDQNVKRRLVSGAVDWNPTDNLKFQLNAAYNKYQLEGRQAMFNLSVNTQDYWHDPVDSTKLYAPDNTYHNVESYNLGANVKYSLNEYFDFRAAYGRKFDIRRMFYTTGQRFINNTNRYGFNLMVFDRMWTNDGVNAYADVKFDTFGVKHKVTFGGDLNYNVYEPVRYRLASGAYSATAVTSNVAGLPFYLFPWGQQPSGTPGPKSLYASEGGRFKQTESFNKNLMLGDEIKFSEQWILLTGLNLANIETKNYNVTTLARSSEYDESALTPTVSLMYKPLSNITVYGTYMEALEQGPTVGTGYTNTGEILSPVRSKQYEAGLKAEWRGMLITSALFQIERASTVDKVNPNGTTTLTKDGKQVNRGVEISVAGKLTEDITLVGGATYVDAKVKKSSTAAQNGNKPRGTPDFTAKLYGEYSLPFVKGLALTGGVYYVGSVYGDDANTFKIKDYTTGDLGLRYTTAWLGPETTLRLAVVNVTNERYWIASDTANAQIGPGRKVYCSLTVGF
jgi:iron complex outermembrane receptor protein